MNRFIVITTINPKSESLVRFEQKDDWHTIVVGDERSEFIPSSDSLTFLSLHAQLRLGYQFATHCPLNHYARKNIGYLYAIQHGADVIYDTDDDNIPYTEWAVPPFNCSSVAVSKDRFINIYQHFTKEFVWPRGFPLDEILNDSQDHISIEKTRKARIGVWQGLTDDDPDTDAIYRLVINRRIKFDKRESIYLGKKHFCPMNSQNTFWSEYAFPYLYLPATTNFRFTDILRGYIAQRLMWQQDLHIGFTDASVYQKRNPHDLMKDFRDEIEYYPHIKKIVEILACLKVSDNPLEDMQNVYKELCKESVVSADELEHLNLWIEDYNNLGRG